MNSQANSAQLLNALNDIQLPEPIGWWPLAFSSWILIFSITSILAGMAWYILDQRRRNRYRREAVAKIEAIHKTTDWSEGEKIARINQVLKQVALTAYGRTATANLYGEEWLLFLYQTADYIAQPKDLHEVLTKAYQPSTESPSQSQQALQTWQEYAIKWIKGHHQ